MTEEGQIVGTERLERSDSGAGRPLLAVDRLTARYGAVVAVRDVSLGIYEGEVVAILGANGAGKSTVLNGIMRLVPNVSGGLSFDGVDLLGLPTEAVVQLGLVLVPERRRLFGSLSVAENLRLGAAARRDRGNLEADLQWVLEFFPVLRRRYRSRASTLSGGEQQMLAIGRALIGRPRLLLLDEPSLGLAPKLVDQLFELLGRLRKEAVTILLVEQNVRGALDLADRGYILRTGRIALKGSTERLRNSGDLLAAYLGVAGPPQDGPAPPGSPGEVSKG